MDRCPKIDYQRMAIEKAGAPALKNVLAGIGLTALRRQAGPRFVPLVTPSRRFAGPDQAGK